MASQPSIFLSRNKILSSKYFPLSPLIAYSLVMFLMATADAIMSYNAPVLMERMVGSSFWMGVMLSTSSMIGFLADILIGEWFVTKRYHFFMFWTIFVSIFFPLTLILLPPIVPVFILSMAIWGIYFELMEFSSFHFIHEFEKPADHNKAWSILYSFKAIAYLLGPIAAGYLLTINTKFSLSASLVLSGFAMLAFLGLISRVAKPKIEHDHASHKNRSFMKELWVWKTLIKRVWPVWIFVLVMTLVDSSFWTVGSLLSEDLKNVHPFGGWLITAYMAPMMFSGLINSRFFLNFGKKKLAFWAGLMNGSFLIAAGMVNNVSVLLLLIFGAGFCTSIAMPKILAATEDLVARLHDFSNDMVGLERSAVSFAYVLGPIFSGGISSFIGHQRTFSVVGGIVVLASFFLILSTPKKILLPQKELVND